MKIVFVNTNDKRSADFSFNDTTGKITYLFVLFKSSAMVLIDGAFSPVNSGDGMLFAKHTQICYYATNGEAFNHDYMFFDTENAIEEMIISEIPKNQILHFSSPKTLNRMLSLLKNELFHTNSHHKNEVLTSISQAFLYKVNDTIIRNSFGLNTTKHQAFLQLRADIYKTPQNDWSIEKICQKMFLSRSYMQHTYKKLFEVSCTEDIINARISRAKSMLLGTNFSVNQIAEECGYKNLTHFIRQFKDKVGISPNKFRQN